MEKLIRYHVIARGRVQNVGCRFFVCMEARNLGITGYVENLYDGTVQMEIQGDPVKLTMLLDAVGKRLYAGGRFGYQRDSGKAGRKEVWYGLMPESQP